MRIKKNNDTIEVVCHGCKSELVVEYDDIDGGHVFGHGVNIFIYCGACERRINLNYNDLPSHWKRWIDQADPEYDDGMGH